MATIKSYTDLQQSKKLAEILPLKSADMFHFIDEVDTVGFGYKKDAEEFYSKTKFEYIPCWSLTTMLDIASTYCSRLQITLRSDKKYNVFAVKDDFVFHSFDNHPDGFDNPIDACYELILKLHKLKML